jgi:ribosomal protein L16 Arg81 hydroxylase
MSKFDFSHLIAPHALDDFFAEYWQQSALLIKRAEPQRFGDLLAVSDIEAVLAMADRLPTEAVELIGKTNAIEHRRPESSALAGFFKSGSTIRVRRVERYSDPLAELCQSIERELGFPTRANLYCTPAGSRGFDLHFDTHEVLVLQLLGKKQWQAYKGTTKLPLEYVPRLSFEDDREALLHSRGGSEAGRDEINATERETLAVEALLEAGDSLYLPRGFVHQAESLNEPSVHLTIGIHVVTWLDLLSVALRQSGRRHESLRRALPLGWGNDHQSNHPGNPQTNLENGSIFAAEFAQLLDLFSQDANYESAIKEVGESMIRTRRDKAGKANLDHKTKVEGTGPLEAYLSDDGDLAGLARGQKVLWMPVCFAPALRFVAASKSFCPSELPGPITDYGKLGFVGRLVEDGFLRIAY